MASEHLGLFDTPPSRREVQLAFVLTGLLVAVSLAVFPYSNVRVGEVAAFVPVVDTGVGGGELIIASLLYAQAAVFRSRALTLLASGFIFIALVLFAHALTFPGAFAPQGLLDPGISSTAWIMILRRLAFPVIVVLYVLLKGVEPEPGKVPGQRAPRVLAWVCGAIALALTASGLAIWGDHLLPPLFTNRRDTIYASVLIFNSVNILLIVAAMALLHSRRRSVLDLWLQVALAGWLMQSVLNLPIHARFTVGWYSLFLVILFSHLIVLLALIVESNRLYARLALSTAAREREREARIMSAEAVASAIFHEVGQPLSALTLGVKTSLTALTRPQPDPERAIASLRDAVDAGRRTFAVIRSVRDTFAKGSDPLSEFSLNDLVGETIALLARELSAQKISVQFELDPDLPPVRANRVQLQRVLVNLLSNAMEALAGRPARSRRIMIRSEAPDDDNVLLELGDTGPGIAPQHMERIFAPYFTTKASGTGLGLALSRTILEDHRGCLWASNRPEGGATFHLQLPRTHGGSAAALAGKAVAAK